MKLEWSLNKIFRIIPLFGYSTIFLLSFYLTVISLLRIFTHRLYLEIIKIDVFVFLLYFSFSIFLLFLTLAIYKKKKWAYKISIILTVFSLYDLFSKTEYLILNLIILASGIILIIYRKDFYN
ncbi:hypothetical protein CO165_04800 [Candidatus Roizmanbacteria bacterium CG_4_9_14_3_um_filter_33_18]|uniref:Uncharacterized protein n=3 Tax=Candidatus Roizmaniibacteriota TaxID=1752723 RepID=A0A2M7UBE6_9BACT|nr:MAG: hypothetical protein COW97_01425 [Candidatus Roizmanbacteria bacterium CG22_combo_CG10-13_8_21_14_all_34_12]PIZ68543.1 MAG: hypothetical protein COY12_00035 [Candidatus Roizmanbacteria bacterium CG_4_10_14_0_2_um_filter_33_96]PJA55200.1 MAG: hypothetical protein CO165_04800 [Candidatus Roizmanbacteria bacterium CG_4_9_14_3_um_filter_33_18]